MNAQFTQTKIIFGFLMKSVQCEQSTLLFQEIKHNTVCLLPSDLYIVHIVTTIA